MHKISVLGRARPWGPGCAAACTHPVRHDRNTPEADGL